VARVDATLYICCFFWLFSWVFKPAAAATMIKGQPQQVECHISDKGSAGKAALHPARPHTMHPFPLLACHTALRLLPQVQRSAKFHSFLTSSRSLLLPNNAKVKPRAQWSLTSYHKLWQAKGKTEWEWEWIRGMEQGQLAGFLCGGISFLCVALEVTQNAASSQHKFEYLPHCQRQRLTASLSRSSALPLSRSTASFSLPLPPLHIEHNQLLLWPLTETGL